MRSAPWLTSRFAAFLLLVITAMSVPVAKPAAAAIAVAPVSELAAGGNLSANGDVVALTQSGETAATLLVGRGGAVPAPVATVGTLPRWAHPHVGTDRRGRAVVVYPRCPSGTATCDLWAYDVDDVRAYALSGINRGTVGETEGVMEKGAVAFTRWTATQDPAQFYAPVVQTTLMYAPARGTARVVTTRGGQSIALMGHQIAQVRNADPSYGECGRLTVELLTIAGRKRTVRTYLCGMESHYPFGLAFVNGQLLWAMHGLDKGHYARHLPATDTTFYQDTSTEFVTAYAPLSASSGLIVNSGDRTSPIAHWTLRSISGLTYPRGRTGSAAKDGRST